MKAILLSLLFVSMTVFCFGVFQFNLGFDVAGNHHVDTGSVDGDYKVNFGISPAIEYMKQYNAIMYGLGAEYQVQRKVDSGNFKGKFGFIPIYAVVRYQFSSPVKVIPEVVAQGGYNFFTGDDDYKGEGTLKGGIYWGVGAGLQFKEKYLIQLMFKTNYGKKEISDLDYKADIDNTQINLSLGVRI